MRADTTEGQRADIHPLPHERPRNPKDAGSVLGRDLGIVGEHGNTVGRGKPVEKIGEGGQGGGRKRECLFCPVAAHEVNIGPCRRMQRRCFARTAWALGERHGMSDGRLYWHDAILLFIWNIWNGSVASGTGGTPCGRSIQVERQPAGPEPPGEGDYAALDREARPAYVWCQTRGSLLWLSSLHR